MEVKNEDYLHICRTCLSETENMNNIFNVADILMTCTPIQVEQGDGLPTTICSDCMLQINQAYKFRLLCEQSDNTLRKKLIKQENINEDEIGPSEVFCRESSCTPDPLPKETLNVPLNKSTTQINKKIQNRKTRKRLDDSKQKEEIKDENKYMKSESTSDESSDEEENGIELSCRFCDLKFRYKVRLKKHEQKHLTGLKCHLCEKDFLTIKQLTNHINIHSRKGAHLCQTCGKQFTLPENLVRHQRIHSGVRPYKCHLCNKSFIQSNELKSHLITHSSEKHHLCSICGNKYARLISLRVHMRRIHSIPPNHRPYICAVCGRSFKDRRDLSQHMLIHTGERSHICNVCGKAFNRSSNLRVHERIHSGHKPHVCPVCQRAFIQKHVLITHMRTHPHQQQQQ